MLLLSEFSQIEMKQRIAVLLTLILLSTAAASLEAGDCPSNCAIKKDYMGHDHCTCNTPEGDYILDLSGYGGYILK